MNISEVLPAVVRGGGSADRRLSNRDYVIFEELSFIRREAQAEADQAYQAWEGGAFSDGYAVYRAAQDRADAAQDGLAAWVRRVAP